LCSANAISSVDRLAHCVPGDRRAKRRLADAAYRAEAEEERPGSSSTTRTFMRLMVGGEPEGSVRKRVRHTL
jgi:hypothetical protein